jgi:hypothetical protein
MHPQGVARHKKHFKSQTDFYAEASTGKLPAFSWLMPPIEACDHPCADVAKGERFQKDVYEALRAGPGWEKTLFLIVRTCTCHVCLLIVNSRPVRVLTVRLIQLALLDCMTQFRISVLTTDS